MREAGTLPVELKSITTHQYLACPLSVIMPHSYITEKENTPNPPEIPYSGNPPRSAQDLTLTSASTLMLLLLNYSIVIRPCEKCQCFLSLQDHSEILLLNAIKCQCKKLSERKKIKTNQKSHVTNIFIPFT